VLRTIFLEFEHADWEDELADFYRSDVEVPAKLIVDGKEYPGVGVHFRGASSYFAVGKGYKRSLNVSLDFTDPKQDLYGYKTLNLLNAHGDMSFASTVLYSEIARRYVPAPKANLVRVAINGEYWGVYTSAQQFDQRFLTDNWQTNRGARWKVKGSPGGDGGLSYVGEDVAEYRRRYEIKSKDDAKDWRALIDLCRTLSETPLDELEAALQPMLDIDGVLWFLALDNALINSDGYWIRASDYCLYRDPKGVFHVVPHDMNEAFRPAMGPGMRGPRGGAPGQGDPMSPPGDRPERAPARPQGVDLDPLVGLNDARKPLRSRLLAVPGLRDRYLLKVRTIAAESLDWQWLGARVAVYRELIDEAVAAETRRLTPYEAFRRAVADGTRTGDAAPGERRPSLGLRSFADQRRAYLLAHPEVEAAAEAGKRP
jgi:spore coat protein CotH